MRHPPCGGRICLFSTHPTSIIVNTIHLQTLVYGARGVTSMNQFLVGYAVRRALTEAQSRSGTSTGTSKADLILEKRPPKELQ